MDPPAPMPYFDRTTMLRAFPVEAADKLIEMVGPGSDCPLVSVEIRMLGGALDREPAVPNAVSSRGFPSSSSVSVWAPWTTPSSCAASSRR
jgi:hypothetical protein